MQNARKYKGNSKAQILLDNGFEQFSKATVAVYKKYLNKMNGPTGSYMRVANILCWSFYSVPYYIEKDGFFIIINDDAYYGGFTAYAPVGDYEYAEGLYDAITFIQRMLEALGEEFELLQCKEWMHPYFDNIKDKQFEWSFDEGESDYLYALQELNNSMSRRKIYYERKIREFTETYKPEYSEYQPEDYGQCLNIIESMFCESRGCEECIFGCMKQAFDVAIDAAEVMEGHIITFKSDNQIIAFIIMCYDGEDLLYFDRKATHNYQGLTEYLTLFVVENFSEKYDIMNYEEDMGSEGLRVHKRAMGPHVLSHNYHIKIIYQGT